jgi:hypothetical protein
MILLLTQLNKDQLDGLAKLSFDIAKGAFALVLLSTTGGSFIGRLVMGLTYFGVGLALTYLALVILEVKEVLHS